MSVLGAGVIGAGFMGQTYARTLSTLVDGVRLAGITGGTRAAGLAAEYGAEHFPTVEAMLASARVDIVFIATPHALHAGQAIAAANAGKHAMIEKPMACSVEDCDAIIAAFEANSVQCSVMFSQRARTCNAAAKALLDSGELGRVLHMRTVQLVPDGMEGAVPKWQLESGGVGILLGHGIHNLDQARWFTGQEVASVYAKARNLRAPCAIEGTSDVILTMAGGTLCYVFCSFEAPKPGFPKSGGATQLICERGLVDIDWYGECRVARAGGEWEIIAAQVPIDWAGKGFLDPVRLESYATVIQGLINAIEIGAQPPISSWDGRQAVAVAMAAYESSRTGLEVRLHG